MPSGQKILWLKILQAWQKSIFYASTASDIKGKSYSGKLQRFKLGLVLSAPWPTSTFRFSPSLTYWDGPILSSLGNIAFSTKLAKLHRVNLPHHQPGQQSRLLMKSLWSSLAYPLIHRLPCSGLPRPARAQPTSPRLVSLCQQGPTWSGGCMLSVGRGSSRAHACGLCPPAERPYRLPHSIHAANHCQQVEQTFDRKYR